MYKFIASDLQAYFDGNVIYWKDSNGNFSHSHPPDISRCISEFKCLKVLDRLLTNIGIYGTAQIYYNGKHVINWRKSYIGNAVFEKTPLFEQC